MRNTGSIIKKKLWYYEWKMYVMDGSFWIIKSIAVNQESHNLAADTAWKPEYTQWGRKLEKCVIDNGYMTLCICI